MTHDLAMTDIGLQLRKAQEKRYLIDLTQDDETIVAVFSPKLQQTTVEAIIGHITRKYGNFVMVIHNTDNKKQIEIINKFRFSVDLV